MWKNYSEDFAFIQIEDQSIPLGGKNRFFHTKSSYTSGKIKKNKFFMVPSISSKFFHIQKSASFLFIQF